jgi:hypothetical protein
MKDEVVKRNFECRMHPLLETGPTTLLATHVHHCLYNIYTHCAAHK